MHKVAIIMDSNSYMPMMKEAARMPGGIPVATVAINGGLNAGLLVARIIGGFVDEISKKISEYTAVLVSTMLQKSVRWKKNAILTISSL